LAGSEKDLPNRLRCNICPVAHKGLPFESAHVDVEYCNIGDGRE
jgi:hypothetical protein